MHIEEQQDESKRQSKKSQNRERKREYFKRKKEEQQKKRKLNDVIVSVTSSSSITHKYTMNKTEWKQHKVNRLHQVYNELGPHKTITVVLDCSFNELMHSREIVSLTQQVMFCYSLNSNTKLQVPFHLSLTSVQGALLDSFQKYRGSDNWIIDKTDQHFTQHFQQQHQDKKIIYLTADADEEVNELEEGTVYILGALVDRNRYKNVCKKTAIEHGVRMARFPIGQYLDLKMAPVLTVNQCLDIMIKVKETGSWKEAVEAVVPLRKRRVTSMEETAQQISGNSDSSSGTGEILTS
jgi:tRNA (guanine9-N1)-methyltransferase